MRSPIICPQLIVLYAVYGRITAIMVLLFYVIVRSHATNIALACQRSDTLYKVMTLQDRGFITFLLQIEESKLIKSYIVNKIDYTIQN